MHYNSYSRLDIFGGVSSLDIVINIEIAKIVTSFLIGC